jgi:hypothetical protein
MKKSKYLISAMTCAVMAALAGCGGSSDVGNVPNTGTGSFQIKVNTPAAVALDAGKSTQVVGAASSFPEPMAAVTWTAVSTNGAPAVTLTNADCASADKKSQASATAGKVTEDWNCALGVQAPANLTEDGKYVLTMTAKDKAGNASNSATQLTVKAATGSTAAPVASMNVPAAAVAGQSVIATCQGSQGYTVKPGVYTYQWVSTPTLPFASTNTAPASFIAPKTAAAQDYEITCRVTDDNQRTVTTTSTLKVSLPAAPTIVPSVVAGRTAAAGELVALDGSASTWVDSYGATTTGQIFYNWSQKQGPTVQLFNADQAKASVQMPNSVSTRTAFIFTLKTSDKAFSNGTTAGTVTSSADVVFMMNPNPEMSLSTTFKDAVEQGSYVTIPVSVTTTPATTLPVYYAWTQVSGETVTMGGTNTRTLNFAAPTNGMNAAPKVLVFRVTAGYEPITVANPGEGMLDVVVVVKPMEAN